MKTGSKATFRHRSKINPRFVFKIFFPEKAIHELNKIVEVEQKFDRDTLISKTGDKKKDKKYDFRKFNTLRPFGREICKDERTLEDALEEQIKSKNEIDKFKDSTKPRTLDKKNR